MSRDARIRLEGRHAPRRTAVLAIVGVLALCVAAEGAAALGMHGARVVLSSSAIACAIVAFAMSVLSVERRLVSKLARPEEWRHACIRCFHVNVSEICSECGEPVSHQAWVRAWNARYGRARWGVTWALRLGPWLYGLALLAFVLGCLNACAGREGWTAILNSTSSLLLGKSAALVCVIGVALIWPRPAMSEDSPTGPEEALPHEGPSLGDASSRVARVGGERVRVMPRR